MGLDATYEELQRFRDALGGFIDVLRTTQQENAVAADRLGGDWDDEFATEFTRRLGELTAPVEQFTGRDAEAYLAFLDLKIIQLRGYLGGH